MENTYAATGDMFLKVAKVATAGNPIEPAHQELYRHAAEHLRAGVRAIDFLLERDADDFQDTDLDVLKDLRRAAPSIVKQYNPREYLDIMAKRLERIEGENSADLVLAAFCTTLGYGYKRLAE